MAHLIEKKNGKPTAFDSLVLEPKKLSIFGSDLSLSIISELAKQPACAMDLSRRMGQHEQKIYYHIRRLENAGIVKHIRSEKRFSMTAKIYGVVSPVISTKLYDDAGEPLITKVAHIPPKLRRFMHPFIDNGIMNSLVIMGDPYPHGEHDSPARGSVHAFDFAVMMGTLLKSANFPNYILDTDVKDDDLKKNLIVFSSPESNTVFNKINDKLPLQFNDAYGWRVKSTLTGKTYNDPRIGVIMKWDSPFQQGKKILVIGGIRTRGIRAAVLAITKHFGKVYENVQEDGNLVRVVQGLDKSGNKIIDSVKFLE